MVKVTTGQLMIYGGIGLTGIGILALCLYVPLFSRQRKRMEQKIKEEY